MKYMYFITASTSLILSTMISSCQRRNRPVLPVEQSTITKPLNHSSDLQSRLNEQINIGFHLQENATVQYKFCLPEEDCPIQSAKTDEFHSYFFNSKDHYSIRICVDSSSNCKNWQKAIIHLKDDINSYQNIEEAILNNSSSNALDSSISTIVFMSEDIQGGLAITALGDRQYVFIRYRDIPTTLTKNEKLQGFELTAPPGLPNSSTGSGGDSLHKNVCFLNSSLQVVHKSAPLRDQLSVQKAIAEMGTDFSDSKTPQERQFIIALSDLMDEMDKLASGKRKNPITPVEVQEVMKAYDDISGDSQKVKLGTKSTPSDWKPKGTQEAADEFLGPLLKFIQADISVTTTRAYDWNSSVTTQNKPRALLNISLDKHTKVSEMILNTYLDEHVDIFDDESNQKNYGTTYKTRETITTEKIDQATFFINDRLGYTESGSRVKNRKAIEIDEIVQMPFKKEGDEKFYQQEMELKSVVLHDGDADGGHYTTITREVHEGKIKWFLYSDAHIRELSREDAFEEMKQKAILINYESPPKKLAIEWQGRPPQTIVIRDKLKPARISSAMPLPDPIRPKPIPAVGGGSGVSNKIDTSKTSKTSLPKVGAMLIIPAGIIGALVGGTILLKNAMEIDKEEKPANSK